MANFNNKDGGFIHRKNNSKFSNSQASTTFQTVLERLAKSQRVFGEFVFNCFTDTSSHNPAKFLPIYVVEDRVPRALAVGE